MDVTFHSLPTLRTRTFAYRPPLRSHEENQRIHHAARMHDAAPLLLPMEPVAAGRVVNVTVHHQEEVVLRVNTDALQHLLHQPGDLAVQTVTSVERLLHRLVLVHHTASFASGSTASPYRSWTGDSASTG